SRARSGGMSAHATPPSVARRAVAPLLLGALLVVACLPVFPWLRARWTASDGFFAHAPLVPLASLTVAWLRRRELARAAGKGSWAGLWLVVPALLVHAASVLLRFDSPAALSLLVALPGFALLLGGPSLLRALAFPLAFLFFAVPLPMFLVADLVQRLKL